MRVIVRVRVIMRMIVKMFVFDAVRVAVRMGVRVRMDARLRRIVHRILTEQRPAQILPEVRQQHNRGRLLADLTCRKFFRRLIERPGFVGMMVRGEGRSAFKFPPLAAIRTLIETANGNGFSAVAENLSHARAIPQTRPQCERAAVAP